jgi:hypothetical protein
VPTPSTISQEKLNILPKASQGKFIRLLAEVESLEAILNLSPDTSQATKEQTL